MGFWRYVRIHNLHSEYLDSFLRGQVKFINSRQLKFNFMEDPGNKTVILSRSMAKLNEMGYIKVSRYLLTLTGQGIEKAKELLKYNPSTS